ncbi:cyclopropane-fatty-acyl-phospholipid synthase [Aliidiomarina sedimenti]|uniref:Cyclopropane-fatty-acyl-phospholipid synthase n=1 Tax=Aliidiomarina sedimenti TaxID=1933879 RepID=A0ABY0BXZ3_9GAMM|nr:cyclopropane fatty acyl phospholipid synthase [Aliidiomarina sedimenti]RUO29353.1 cyclopropane-fatty-acyl-phospholipid synthase [Aliidiomarina sedimenti]
MSSQDFANELLAKADIQINGSRPWDLQLHRDDVIPRALAHGNLGLGEAYMDGHWDCEHLDQFFSRLLQARIAEQVHPSRLIMHSLKNRLFNLQGKKRAWEVGQKHYDLGNDLYQKMLDKRMVYTCGFWTQAKDLDTAQEHKLELTCRKLKLKPGMRVLDVGCGWGSFMQYAAEHYGVECVGVTISKAQIELGKERFKGLPVEFLLNDYRDLPEIFADKPFDAVVSLGMFEHVGPKNHRTYMQVVNQVLKEHGLFLLHTIGRNAGGTPPDPWIDKYIFPNGELPAIRHVGEAAEKLFVVEDLHNFGASYDKTLMAWHDNFERGWPELQKNARYDTRFYRMWRYYLLSCAGAFRARNIQLWQWVLSKQGVEGHYERPAL